MVLLEPHLQGDRKKGMAGGLHVLVRLKYFLRLLYEPNSVGTSV